MVGDSLGVFFRVIAAGVIGTTAATWAVLGFLMFLSAPFVFWIFVISELFGS